MSKSNVVNKNKFDVTNLIFLIGMIVVTIIFVVIMIITAVRPSTVKDLNKIKEIDITEYNTLGSESQKEYLIFVYSSEKNKNYNYSIYRNNLVINTVLEYASYVKEKGGIPIYRLDVSKDENRTAISVLSLTNESFVPAIIKINYSNNTGSINTRKNTPADVNTYLKSLMK